MNVERKPTNVFLTEIGRKSFLQDGWSVMSEISNPIIDPNVVTDEVDEHESDHLLVAAELGVPIEEGSVIPEGDSLGHVKTGHFSAPVAMASHGRSGNGHDRMLVRLHGESESTAAAVAESILSKKPKHKKALAILLHKKKKISGTDVHAELKKVDQGETAETKVVDPEGREYKIITMRIHEGDHIEIDMNKLLPKAA